MSTLLIICTYVYANEWLIAHAYVKSSNFVLKFFQLYWTFSSFIPTVFWRYLKLFRTFFFKNFPNYFQNFVELYLNLFPFFSYFFSTFFEPFLKIFQNFFSNFELECLRSKAYRGICLWRVSNTTLLIKWNK